MIKKKIQKNKKNYFKKNHGIVLLFAIMISSVILAIALGVSSIAFNETKFSISAKDANEAFFAADTGAECALFNDKTILPHVSSFNNINTNNISAANCFGFMNDFDVSEPGHWEFTLPNLGNSNEACAKVSVDKTLDSISGITTTKIISKGYNLGGVDCNSTSPNLTERVLELNR